MNSTVEVLAQSLYHLREMNLLHFYFIADPIGGRAVGGFPFADNINNKSGMMAPTSLHQYSPSLSLYTCDLTNYNYEMCLPLYFIPLNSIVQIVIRDST